MPCPVRVGACVCVCVHHVGEGSVLGVSALLSFGTCYEVDINSRGAKDAKF